VVEPEDVVRIIAALDRDEPLVIRCELQDVSATSCRDPFGIEEAI
jgi:hypothetical protein